MALRVVLEVGFLGSGSLPTWFAEGLAVEVSDGGGAEGVTEDELRRLIADGHAFVPDTDEGLIRKKGASAFGLEAHAFYGEAGLFVRSLRTLDEPRFRVFLHDVSRGTDFGDAFRSAYGVPIEAAWGRFVSGTKRPPPK